MRRHTNRFRLPIRALLLAASLITLASVANADQRPSDADANRYWPQWRGPLGTGEAPGAKPPLEWGAKKNIRWKVELPGRGHSTPVVWGPRVFLTTAVPYGDAMKPKYSGAPGAHDNLPVTHRHEFVVLAVDRRDGKILWRKTVRKDLPHEGGHNSASLASGSPVTDGKLVFAMFGSRGLFCLDVEGNLKWKADLGKMNTKHGHGEGSSPALSGDTLVVNWDHEGRSFIIAFDKNTGRQRWKKDRGEATSWATPIITVHDGKPQVIVSGTSRVRAYDLATGRVLWQCGGLSANIVATPVAAHGMVFAGSSYEKRALLAIRLDGARGDITGSDRIAWSRRRGTPYVPSPLVYGDSLYFLAHYQGVLARLNSKTGKESPGSFRLGGIRNVYASPVGAAGRVYVTDLRGTTMVISHDATPKILAINRLDDVFSASAAIADDEIYLRGAKHLYCIAKE